MQITPIKQSDPKWANYRLGNSAVTMASDGCYVSSLCMALHSLRGYFCDPRDAVRYWLFTLRGYLMQSTKFKGMKIVRRFIGLDKAVLTEYLKAPDKAVVLQLNNGAHFVFADRVSEDGVVYVDPLDGEYHHSELKNGRLNKKYRITGMRLIEGDEIKLPDWLKADFEKAKGKGLSMSDPAVKMSVGAIIDVLLELKLIDKPKDEITLGEFIVTLSKIKERW